MFFLGSLRCWVSLYSTCRRTVDAALSKPSKTTQWDIQMDLHANYVCHWLHRLDYRKSCSEGRSVQPDTRNRLANNRKKLGPKSYGRVSFTAICCTQNVQHRVFCSLRQVSISWSLLRSGEPYKLQTYKIKVQLKFRVVHFSTQINNRNLLLSVSNDRWSTLHCWATSLWTKNTKIIVNYSEVVSG